MRDILAVEMKGEQAQMDTVRDGARSGAQAGMELGQGWEGEGLNQEEYVQLMAMMEEEIAAEVERLAAEEAAMTAIAEEEAMAIAMLDTGLQQHPHGHVGAPVPQLPCPLCTSQALIADVVHQGQQSRWQVRCGCGLSLVLNNVQVQGMSLDTFLEGVRAALGRALEAHFESGCGGHAQFRSCQAAHGPNGLYLGCAQCKWWKGCLS